MPFSSCVAVDVVVTSVVESLVTSDERAYVRQTSSETLQHELVHAWQECNRNRKKDPHDTCARVVQEELAAYRESGECQRKVRTGEATSVTQCMIDGAIGSTYSRFCATESEARREAIRWLSSVDPSIYPNLP